MAKLFFFGDSIVAGAWDAEGGWVSRIIRTIMTRCVDAAENDDNFYCMPYNLGVSGNTLPDLLARLESEVKARRSANMPDEMIQLVFAIGTNDTTFFVNENRPRFTDDEFRNNIRALIKMARAITPHVKFIGLLPVDQKLLSPIPWAPTRAFMNDRVDNFENIIRDMCCEYSLPFLPLFKKFKETKGFEAFFIDGLHPNTKGHAWMQEQIEPFIFTDEFFKINTL